jgi:hypothetical protein
VVVLGVKLIAEDPVTIRIRPKIEAIYDVHGRVKAERRIAPQWARDIALTRFQMKTAPDFSHPETEITAGEWVAYLDTDEYGDRERWTPEEKTFAEERLLEIASECGHLIVEKPLPVAPYALYDKHRIVHGQRTVEHVIKDIRSAHELAGFDAVTAIKYERETLNDPKVIEFLESLIPAAVEEPEEELIGA